MLMAMAAAYVDRLQTDRDLLMLQLHAYAACDDDVIRDHVRDAYAGSSMPSPNCLTPTRSGSTSSSATGCR